MIILYKFCEVSCEENFKTLELSGKWETLFFLLPNGTIYLPALDYTYYCMFKWSVSYFSWHMQQVLQSLGYTHISEEYHCLLQASFASQLETYDLWEWAVYVLSHIKSPQRQVTMIHVCLDFPVWLCLNLYPGLTAHFQRN